MNDQPTRRQRPGSSELPADPQREPAVGERVGNWRITRKLGGGGFGVVYAAEHHETRQPAALKVLHAHFVTSAEMLARFDREIRVLDLLRHRNIVQIVDAGFDRAGRPYLAMELLAGEDLANRIANRGPLALAAARTIFEHLCEATAFAHQLGVVHRDLKASNVFLCDDAERVVLLDFGIAKISDALAPELTASHQSIGTPGCMAPEQVHGSRVDARTDVYALAGLLFHMLTGRLPFQDPSETMTQYLHLHARRPRVSTIVPVTPRLDDVIVRAMAIEPANRFDDARSLLEAVRSALRESRFHHAVSVVEYAAIHLSVGDRTDGAALDEALLADLESVLPVAERFLGELGFSLALDLGSSALFLAPATAADPIGAAVAAWQHLEQRSGRDPRVRVGLCVHRGSATVVGTQVEPGPLLRPTTWPVPDRLDGIWATEAIEPSTPGGRRVR